jgi:SH3-like domain-containing protein
LASDLFKSLLLPIGVLAALSLSACGKPDAAVKRPTPSGLPVPRYVSLQHDPVNARAGPGEDYKTLWVYHARGMPLQVIAETTDWRRVCDPDGGRSWIKRTGVDGARTVLRTATTPLPLRAAPKLDAAVKAYLQPRALAELDKDTGPWLRLKAAGVVGWAPAAEVWGAATAPQCR